jgi:hypothetical protein
MKSWMQKVQGGASRPAPRWRTVLVILGVLLLSGAGVRKIRKGGREEAPFPKSRSQETRGAEQQDSASVRAFLAKVRGIDPTICALMSRSIGNRWGGWYGLDAIGPYGSAADDRLLSWLDRAEIARELVPILRIALADNDACVRRTAAQLLGRTRSVDLAVELRNELAAPEATTREAALIALGHFDRPSVLEPARSALRDADANVRIAAAWVLGMLEGAEASVALMATANDADMRVRSTVAWALGEIEHTDAIPTLVRLLEDRDAQVRRAAAAALGRIGG